MTNREFVKFIKDNGKKHIIFDFDETLATLLVDWNFWIEDMKRLFYSIDKRKVEKVDHKIQNDYIKKYGPKMRKKIIEVSYKNEREHYSGYETNKKAVVILPELANFSKLYIWTSNDTRTVTPALNELEIKKYFKKIISRNDVEFIKPDDSGFALIWDGVSAKSSYLMVGDSQADSGAARMAGIDYLDIREIR